MKILLIGTDSQISGASLSMVKLAQQAKEKGIEIRILIPCEGPLEEELKKNELKYYIVKSYNWIVEKSCAERKSEKIKILVKKCFNQLAEIKVRRIIHKYSPDIIHINTICSGVGAKAAYACNKKVIWHIREFVEEDHGYVFWNKRYSYDLIAKAHVLVAISNSVYDKFSPIFGKEKVLTIYNGIDIEKFYCDFEHCMKDETKFKIYMGGSIAKSKGQELLIKAAEFINSNYDYKFEIHFCGKGDSNYIDELKKMVTYFKLDSIISFDGFKNSMQEEWRKADIAIVASRAEAFGRVTVEAMLSGALVVGANSAGTAEIIKDSETGILFENGDAVDLAKKIVWAFQHKETAKLIASNGKEEAKKKYNAERNADEISELYKNILL